MQSLLIYTKNNLVFSVASWVRFGSHNRGFFLSSFLLLLFYRNDCHDNSLLAIILVGTAEVQYSSRIIAQQRCRHREYNLPLSYSIRANITINPSVFAPFTFATVLN